MKTSIAVFLAGASVFLSAPAFASGYGPAPFYVPSIGAPASQRGQSEQTVSAERNDTGSGFRKSDPGVEGPSQAAGRAPVTPSQISNNVL